MITIGTGHGATTWLLVTMSPLESNVTPDPSPLSVWICTTSGCVALTTATYCASRPAADDGEAEEVPLAEVIVVWSCLNHRSLSPGRDGMFAQRRRCETGLVAVSSITRVLVRAALPLFALLLTALVTPPSRWTNCIQVRALRRQFGERPSAVVLNPRRCECPRLLDVMRPPYTHAAH